MSFEGATQRLLQDAAMIPLGNIPNALRRSEREAQSKSIADALQAGITEKAIFLALHDGRPGLPSAKVAQLITLKKESAAT